MTDYIVNEKGEEVISERHQKDFKKEFEDEEIDGAATVPSDSPKKFTDVSFDDI